MNAEDPDINRRSNIRYGLTGQFYNEGYFTINEITGDVYITKRLDRDKPNGRAMWSFNVLAHDEPGSGQSLTGYAVVKVKPKDINDNAPRFDTNRLEGKVPEHSRAGEEIQRFPSYASGLHFAWKSSLRSDFEITVLDKSESFSSGLQVCPS